jgi:CubicO group peptidase (beta-lactamase class C family)
MRYRTTVLGFFLAGAEFSPVLEDRSNAYRVDAIFADYDDTDSPGCSVAVFRDGRIDYARGYGMANLEHAVANSGETVFDIGSTSKQFTAMAILLLEYVKVP